jgi:hypothetical protein
MFTTASNEYFVKLSSGETDPKIVKFFKYFFDRRYEIAKQFPSPVPPPPGYKGPPMYPIYPINTMYFVENPKDAKAFAEASVFHYQSGYYYTTRQETKNITSGGMVF